MACTVTILVAAYNSARYLEELLRSLLAQTHKDLDIVIRDDGSEDSTKDIIDNFCDSDHRIRSLDVNSDIPGTKDNFFKLLLSTDSEYTMFCDSDDVWKPEKTEKTLALMRKTENSISKETPILVHTDLTVVDETLKEISPSFFRYEKLSPHRNSFKQLLVQNNVTGCTVMINRALKNKVFETPENAVMHDWWFALTAAAFGRIEVLYESTILYRQHQSNQIGASDAGDLSAMMRKIKNTELMRKTYDSMYAQAACFAEAFKNEIDEDLYTLARQYSEMAYLSKPGKIFRIFRRGFYKNSLSRNLGQFLVV